MGGFPGLPAIPDPTINLYSVGGTVSYDLDLFGGLKRRSEQAQARADQAARDADAAYLTLSGNVAIQAMRIAGIRAQIAALEAVVAEDQHTLDLVQKALAAVEHEPEPPSVSRPVEQPKRPAIPGEQPAHS